MFDSLDNVRWIVMSKMKVFFALYTEQHATTYREYSLYDNITDMFGDTTKIIQACHNAEAIVYCRHDYNTFTQAENTATSVLSELGNGYRQMYPRLTEVIVTDVWYGTLRYYIMNGFIFYNTRLSTYIAELSAEWPSTYTICNLLDKPVTGWFGSRQIIYEGKNAEKPNKMIMYTQYKGTETEESTIVNNSMHDYCNYEDMIDTTYDYVDNENKWKKASERTHYNDRFYPTYTYDIVRTELTAIMLQLLCIQGLTNRTIHKLKVDSMGRMYFNDILCNVKIPYKYLLGAPDNVWLAVMGMTANVFRSFVAEQINRATAKYIDVCNLTTEYFCAVVQEQHVPRWGYLFDYCFIADFYRLTDIDIFVPEIAVMMQRDLSLGWDTFYHRYSLLHRGHFIINGVVVDDNKQYMDMLQLYTQLQQISVQ